MERFSYLSCKLLQESLEARKERGLLASFCVKKITRLKKVEKAGKGTIVVRKAEKTITVLKKHALTKILSNVFSTSKNVCRNDHDDGKLYTLICQLAKKKNTPL